MLSKLWSFIELRTNRMVQVCRWIIELGAFGLIVFVLIVIVKETSRPEIIIDAIDVPEDMVKSGYTGIVVAQKLADEAHNLSLKILEESDKSKYLRGIYLRGLIGPNYVKTNFAFSDISLPIAQNSLQTITRFMRQKRGNLTYIRGEIVHKDNNFVLTIRNISGKNAPPLELPAIESKKIEQLFQNGNLC